MTQLSNLGYWLAAWTIIIILLIAASHTTWGRTIIYYIAWLSIVLILVTHSDTLSTIFTKANITAGES